MRHRDLRRQVQYGAGVAVLFLVALPVAALAGIRGVEAIRAGAPSTAIVSWLMSLGAAVIPVVALAIYLHWLSATTDDTSTDAATGATTTDGATDGATDDATPSREMHVPTRAEDWLLGIGTALAVLAGVPILSFAYHGSVDSRASGDVAFAIGYGVLGLAYIVFAGFCVERYVQWMR